MTKYFNKIASTLQTRYIKFALRHNVATLIYIDTIYNVDIAMLIIKVATGIVLTMLFAK
jgi:hypothetical protein